MKIHLHTELERSPKSIHENSLTRYYRGRIREKIVISAIGLFSLLLLFLYQHVVNPKAIGDSNAAGQKYPTQTQNFFCKSN